MVRVAVGLRGWDAAFLTGNGGPTRDVGERFRRRLLAHGGSIDVMHAYRDYRGRDADLTHLLERLGLYAR